MEKQTFGMMIASLRKEKGMTQQELAEKMNVTDKAVSKWERDLSFPDINTLPKLAEIFEISVDALMQVETKTPINKNKIDDIFDTVLRGLGIAMGIAVTVLAILKQLEINTAFMMLGIGLTSISIYLMKDKN